MRKNNRYRPSMENRITSNLKVGFLILVVAAFVVGLDWLLGLGLFVKL